jgi:hypothetical protein
MRRRPALLALLVACVAAFLLFLALRRDVPGATTVRPEPAPDAPGQASSAAPDGTAAPHARLPIRIPPAPAGAPDDAPATFDGRVVAADRGAGIGGAELTFARGGAAASARSDATGAFRFEPPTAGRWRLAAVTASGYLPFAPEWGHSPVELDARPGLHVQGIEIHLSPEVRLAGRVVDEEDRPVAGAEVRLLGTSGESALVPVPDRFTTDAGGAFSFVAPEGAVVAARKDGFLPGRAEVTRLALLNGTVVVRLGPAHRSIGAPAPIAGRVVGPDGAPVAGALVAAEGMGRFGVAGAAAAQALSGTDGTFVLEDLMPGGYHVIARAEGLAPASARRVRPGTTDVVLTLEPGGRLRGCVRNASTGAPIAPFTVAVFARRSALRLFPQRSLSVIDPSGCYRIDDLQPGPAAVVIAAPGHAPSPEVAVDVPAPGAGEAVADATLEPGGTLTGVVVDETSRAPLAGASLEVEGALAAAASTFPVLSSATTDSAGRFTLRGLPKRFSIYAAAAGHHARIVGGVEVASGATAGPIEVALRALDPGEEPRVELAGIGAVLAARGEGLVVATVVAGGGAAEAGLVEGDLILRVDGRPVVELGMTGAIDAIRGPEGTFVLLAVRRGEGATQELRVARRLVRG